MGAHNAYGEGQAKSPADKTGSVKGLENSREFFRVNAMAAVCDPAKGEVLLREERFRVRRTANHCI